jgi:hypothetical protein
MDEFTAQDIGGDQPTQIEQEKKSDNPQPGEEKFLFEKIDGYMGYDRGEDTIQSVKDKLQDKKRNPKG